jgi:small GTP-binding protein
MAQKKNELIKQSINLNKESPNLVLKLLYTLHSYMDNFYKIALSSDGHILASSLNDNLIKLWNIEKGQSIQTLTHETSVTFVAWSPDGITLAVGSSDGKKVYLWNTTTGKQLRVLEEQGAIINSISWSIDGKTIVSCSNDKIIRLWDAENGLVLHELKGHTNNIECVACSPDGKQLCSGSWDETICIWNMQKGEIIQTLTGHKNSILCIAWSPDGKQIVSGSSDQTIRIWNPETGKQTHVLEGHTDAVISISFLDNGRLLASLDENGMVIIWRTDTDTWAEVMRTNLNGNNYTLCSLAGYSAISLIAVINKNMSEIDIWQLDYNLNLVDDKQSVTPSIFYINAKVVLLGDSGVGKSGLGIRLATGKFEATDSTHGAQFWHFPTESLPGLPPNLQAELTLWDLAGQPDYRLTHQLFLDDIDAALLLFDYSDADDPFRGVPYWSMVLKKHAPEHTLKFLVASRCDKYPVSVGRDEINHILTKYGIDNYFETSAMENIGIEKLFKELLKGIPWDKLPRTSTPELFHVLREFLLECKADNKALISIDEIHKAASERFTERAVTEAEIDAVIKLLQSRGLIFRLNPKQGITKILLKPELINQYGSSIIQAARKHPLGISSISERDVQAGNIFFSGFNRLSPAEEAMVLEVTTELLFRYELCFREMGYLVFPSQMNISRILPTEAHPRTEVAYRFSGSIEAVYASLVVRLNYTDYFHLKEQWKYAAEFSRENIQLGFSMRQVKDEEGTGELEIYFYPGISEFDRVTFIRFVTDHLHARGVDIQKEIRLYCPKCSKEITNHDAIEARVNNGFTDIPCQYCTAMVIIPVSIEEKYRKNPSFGEKQQELVKNIAKRTAAEMIQFRTDQQQYTQIEDHRIHILHLSDLHIANEEQAKIYRARLETDLIQGLNVKRLEYLVISGDIANHSTEDEYRAAFSLVDGLVKRFGLDASRVVVVPGNHDLNWEESKNAYQFTYNPLPKPLKEGQYFSGGDEGVLLCNEELYQKRFNRFSEYFYKKVYPGKEYPLKYSDQYLLVERPNDHILFLGLNSCWQIDHYFKSRASINMHALSQILDKLQDDKYDGWLKMAVWHHPVTGREMMNDEFMELLTLHGFQVCLHGHIHETIATFHQVDDKYGIRIIGAGTFGAPANEQITGIPLQYNLLIFDPQIGEINVQTRKKEKPDGLWSADSRWGDRNDPKPWYRINIKSKTRNNEVIE